jgi:hypothetical protein
VRSAGDAITRAARRFGQRPYLLVALAARSGRADEQPLGLVGVDQGLAVHLDQPHITEGVSSRDYGIAWAGTTGQVFGAIRCVKR